MEPSIQRCHDPYLRCALYGAAQVALGVTGSGVISHSPQGCYQLVDAAFGWQDADYTETEVLCTKLCEVEIVHGGEDLLARTILEAQALNVRSFFWEASNMNVKTIQKPGSIFHSISKNTRTEN